MFALPENSKCLAMICPPMGLTPCDSTSSALGRIAPAPAAIAIASASTGRGAREAAGLTAKAAVSPAVDEVNPGGSPMAERDVLDGIMPARSRTSLFSRRKPPIGSLDQSER